MIAVCIISFMDITYSAKEGYMNYGKLWLVMSDDHRFSYMGGFVAGMDLWIPKALPIITLKIEEGLLSFEEVEIISELLDLRTYFLSLDGDGFLNIVNVITDLYKDPANTYIHCCKMINFAYQKLKGENIEPLLREAREREREREREHYIKERNKKVTGKSVKIR